VCFFHHDKPIKHPFFECKFARIGLLCRTSMTVVGCKHVNFYHNIKHIFLWEWHPCVGHFGYAEWYFFYINKYLSTLYACRLSTRAQLSYALGSYWSEQLRKCLPNTDGSVIYALVLCRLRLLYLLCHMLIVYVKLFIFFVCVVCIFFMHRPV
jgi:hypothetical protein